MTVRPTSRYQLGVRSEYTPSRKNEPSHVPSSRARVVGRYTFASTTPPAVLRKYMKRSAWHRRGKQWTVLQMYVKRSA
eukprot:366573-Chlamydomonas_euryale.AAC.38